MMRHIHRYREFIYFESVSIFMRRECAIKVNDKNIVKHKRDGMQHSKTVDVDFNVHASGYGKMAYINDYISMSKRENGFEQENKQWTFRIFFFIHDGNEEKSTKRWTNA